MMFGLKRPATIAGTIALLVLLAPAQLPGAPATAGAGCRHAKARPWQVPPRELKKATMCVINAARRRHGVGGAERHRNLKVASYRHSDYMTEHNCFSHQCGGEPDLYGRISRTGYFSGVSSYACGEVIAAASRRRATPRRIVTGWLHSDAHRSVVLSRAYEHQGAGVVRGAPWQGGSRTATYTVDFCRRGG